MHSHRLIHMNGSLQTTYRVLHDHPDGEEPHTHDDEGTGVRARETSSAGAAR